MLGIEPGQLATYAFNVPGRGNVSPTVQLYRRFFSAILLFTLIQEWPLTSVTKLISGVTRGQLQQLQKDAAVFCGMTVVFCRKLNWPILASCLDDFSGRLNHGVHSDILPLVRLGSEVTPSRARIFLKNGIETPDDLLHTELEVLTELLMESLPFDGKDPLTAATNVGGSGGGMSEANSSSGNISGFIQNSKEFARTVSIRLAKQILSRYDGSVTSSIYIPIGLLSFFYLH
jgi:hypothetical protein